MNWKLKGDGGNSIKIAHSTLTSDEVARYIREKTVLIVHGPTTDTIIDFSIIHYAEAIRE